MALSFTALSALSTPPSKTDPANFSSRADTFLAELPDFQTEMNTVITELNKITSGLDSASPIAAWAVGTTYNFPDLVAGSDGYTYRCVGTAVVGQDPIADDGTYWMRIAEAPLGNPTVSGMVLSSTTAGVRSWVATLPVGAVVPMAVGTVPDGYLECDGSAVSRTTYAGLFTALSDDYGAGDGTTTFNLPDYRGRFLRGWDHGAGVDPNAATRTNRGDGTTGDYVGTKQAEALKAHSHSIGTYPGQIVGDGNNTTISSTDESASYALSTGSSSGSETRPINTTVMYVIKY